MRDGQLPVSDAGALWQVSRDQGITTISGCRVMKRLYDQRDT
jgi:hypothetical protein